jgi:hypothetical protein
MFMEYAGMTMPERNTIAAEWPKTITIVDEPNAVVQKV